MKLTLPQVFALSLIGLLAALALLFSQVVSATRRTLEDSSDRLRAAVSERINERVPRFLSKASASAQQVQFALNRGLVDPHDPLALEGAPVDRMRCVSDFDYGIPSLRIRRHPMADGSSSYTWIQVNT